MILASEGVNATLSGTKDSLHDFMGRLRARLQLPSDLPTKASSAETPPFKRFHIKLRSEIVTLDRPDIRPQIQRGRHLSPEEWDRMMKLDDTIVVDTRNGYETKIGKFQNAVDFNIDEFTDFPDKIKGPQWNRDKNYLIYCTGGIRCEKAIHSMEEMGFKNVYQLDGGILNYLKEKPEGAYNGECFVFDSRVAVDKNLAPSKQYSLCPHCGDVSELDIECLKCETPAKICKPCSEKAKAQKHYQTCSKNCSYHYKRDPLSKSPRQQRHYHGP